MPDRLLMLTMMTVIPACLLGAAAVAASLRAPRSELAFFLGMGMSVLGVVIALFWFWTSGQHLYSPYTFAALWPIITGTFTLARAVR